MATTYELHDSHYSPQAGCEIISFETFGDLMEYLDNNPDVMERIEEGYATIV